MSYTRRSVFLTVFPGALDSSRVPQGSLSGYKFPRENPTLTRDGEALSDCCLGVLSVLSFGGKDISEISLKTS